METRIYIYKNENIKYAINLSYKICTILLIILPTKVELGPKIQHHVNEERIPLMIIFRKCFPRNIV